MRVNIYAEEMTDRVEIISKEIDGHAYTGLRLYLELPVTVNGEQVSGPFMHRPGDDDSSAVTFWGKRDLREALRTMQTALDAHYAHREQAGKDQHEACDRAPAGWICTRGQGHTGPCAAHRAAPDALRQDIGEALSAKLYELMDNGKQAFDACDAYNIDLILDELVPVIVAHGVGAKGNHAPIDGDQDVRRADVAKPPRRAIQFRLEAQADTPTDLAATLFNFFNRASADDLSEHSSAGGYGAHYEHWLTVSDRPTHEEYIDQLNAYLADRRRS